MEEKDLELVVKERERETYCMMQEEYLTHYDEMRKSRDSFQSMYQSTSTLATSRQESIKQLLHDHAEEQRRRTEGMIEFGTQTVIGANYFNKKPGGAMAEMGSSRGSGSLQSSSQQNRGLQGKGRGGGRGGGRPPPGGSKQGSNAPSQGGSPSKQGRPGVDTTSSRAPSMNDS